MPQLLSRGTPGSVTVAELLRRCAPAPPISADGPDDAQDDFSATTTISVGALLRREGREAPSDDRPWVIGSWTSPARAVLVRRGAIAAGALLAAGTVFGLTGVMNAATRQPVATGSYAGDGALEPALNPASDAQIVEPTSESTASAVTPTSLPVIPAALQGSHIAQHAIAPRTATGVPSRAAVPSTSPATTAPPRPTQDADTARDATDDSDHHATTTPTKRHTPAHDTSGDDPTTTTTPPPPTTTKHAKPPSGTETTTAPTTPATASPVTETDPPTSTSTPASQADSAAAQENDAQDTADPSD